MTPWKDQSPAEKRAAVKEQILAGKSFGEIAEELHSTSRASIAGIVSKLRELGELPPPAPKQKTGAAGGAISRKSRAKLRAGALSAVATTSPRAARAQPAMIILPAGALRAAISAMVDAYIAVNGVRRFERGVADDLEYLRGYLARHGFEISYIQRGRYPYSVRGRGGRPRSFDRPGLFAFVDELRIADGKEPFIPRKDNAHGARA